MGRSGHPHDLKNKYLQGWWPTLNRTRLTFIVSPAFLAFVGLAKLYVGQYIHVNINFFLSDFFCWLSFTAPKKISQKQKRIKCFKIMKLEIHRNASKRISQKLTGRKCFKMKSSAKTKSLQNTTFFLNNQANTVSLFLIFSP